MSAPAPDAGRITVERDGAIAVVVIDHAARNNTLTAAMRTALADALAALDGDASRRRLRLRLAHAGSTAVASISTSARSSSSPATTTTDIGG